MVVFICKKTNTTTPHHHTGSHYNKGSSRQPKKLVFGMQHYLEEIWKTLICFKWKQPQLFSKGIFKWKMTHILFDFNTTWEIMEDNLNLFLHFCSEELLPQFFLKMKDVLNGRWPKLFSKGSDLNYFQKEDDLHILWNGMEWKTTLNKKQP